MFCRNCGKPIEGPETICPECAAELAEQTVPVPSEPEDAPVDILPDQEPLTEEPEAAPAGILPDQEPLTEEPEAAPADVSPVQEPDGTSFSVNTENLDKPENKKKTGLIALISACAAILVIGLICLFNWSAISSLFNRNFLSPDDYLRRVEEKSMDEGTAINTISAAYGRYLQSLSVTTAAIEADMHIRMDDSILTILQTALAQNGVDIDLDWISDVLVEYDYTYTEDGVQIELGLGLEDSRIITVSVIMDYTNGDIFIAAPELNETYLKVNASDMEMEEFFQAISQSMEQRNNLAKDLPDEKAFAQMLRKYAKMVTGNLKNVEKSTQRLKADEITQDVTALTAKVYDADAYNILIQLLEEVKNDSDLQKLAIAYSYNYGEDLTVEDFQESIDEAINYMKELETGDEMYLLVTTYVDSKDNILGRSLKTSDGEFDMYYYTVYRGDDFAFEAKICEDGEEYCLVTGKGSEKKGLVSGQYVLTEEGDELLILDLDQIDIGISANGKSTGTARLTLGSAAMQDFTDYMNGSFAAMMRNATLAFEIAADGDTNSLRIILNGVPLFTIDLKTTEKAPTAITIPDNVLDAANGSESDLMAWLANMDLSGVISSLKEKNVPDEVLDALTGLQQQLDFLSMLYAA